MLSPLHAIQRITRSKPAEPTPDLDIDRNPHLCNHDHNQMQVGNLLKLNGRVAIVWEVDRRDDGSLRAFRLAWWENGRWVMTWAYEFDFDNGSVAVYDDADFALLQAGIRTFTLMTNEVAPTPAAADISA